MTADADPGNLAFRKAIDNIFKKVANRGRDHAEDAALRGRTARTRADEAGGRRRKHAERE